ncbi:MAG: 16S rRNA (cytidine(1402)-2'-O)-methyltransferase [Vicinamibacterales bacterium]
MAGTLFLVSTPIGNLEDITLRALRLLREADVIAAEDTRRTRGLLAHHGIDTPMLSFHEHNTRTRLPRLMARLEAGEKVALVTDAGTPSISDPGLELVRACIDQGIEVDPIPGASAPLAAGVASGFPLAPWTILGFPPLRSKDRSGWWAVLSETRHTVTFFEAPHRIRRTLEEASLFLAERPIMVARELTKAHQEFLRGSASALAQRLHSPRGEFTIVVGPIEVVEDTHVEVSDEVLASEFWRITETGNLGRRAAINRVAKEHGRPAREVYLAVEKHKKSVV